ncbi:MAG: glutamine--fructose-6-phosphate transaminase (isomerizing) [Dehalococcoidia bacterium]|nr:glutamine--fructose-6-phosphate transaminase (isomerizing) [Dehalococcoidia bacterium]MDP6228973.1 glutamine--fructose-6-phosphate transaminase (isomerizing) [Dehalococcoidia bacterium]MDP7084413.1 glutamine--fructose-6-phosphate transaminase (isomerizing) [Dehalococcoidia bacterium]MDP7200918.1 glutamine--fructose-6-phosphate transaminase (isomerizing) [Dehalococcoidia bacterium]HJN85940.1 glutamine--fructose-6-phosphate transaminase (isomerizing) [Dehalococcoidia bacterium]
MCGIVGYVGDKDAWPIIFEGLRRLEYRGYDSAGIAILDPAGELQFRRAVGKVGGLAAANQRDLPQGSVGLGHTRWATHGRPSDANAHPHTDCQGRIAVVHNGIVENFVELKSRLQAEGHHFSSETDTEVITHLVEEGVDQGLSFEDAFRRMGKLLQGSQAVTATHQGHSGIICALRLGYAGGIVVAHRDGQGIICSDLPALVPLFRHDPVIDGVGFLDSGEMAVVTREGTTYSDLEGRSIEKEVRTVSQEDILIDKGGFRHFMLKEIMEQPQAVASAMRQRVDFQTGRVDLAELPLSNEEIKALTRVVLIGCGTSLHAAQVGRHLVERLAGLPAEAESASEFRHRDPYIDERTLVVAIGQSGETADTVAAMHLVREKGSRLITICNVEGSQATRMAEGTLYMRSGIEIGVASTKTFIASLTTLNLLAVYLGRERGFIDPDRSRQLVDDLSQCPRLVGEMLADTDVYRQMARRYSTYDNFLFLGRGMNAPIALEGALKLKEISYIHAEGLPAGEMKHGPIALIDRNMAIVALAPRDGPYDKVVNNIKEVKARDGVVLAIVTEGDQDLPSQVDDVLYIPQAPENLVPLLAAVPLQLLAYHIAVVRGCDVDQPRNLAKSVTVE